MFLSQSIFYIKRQKSNEFLSSMVENILKSVKYDTKEKARSRIESVCSFQQKHCWISAEMYQSVSLSNCHQPRHMPCPPCQGASQRRS